MRTAQLLLLVILFVGDVLSDDSANIVSKSPEISTVLPNTSNRNIEDATLDSAVTVGNLNNSTEEPESVLFIEKVKDLKAEDELSNATNSEVTSNKTSEAYSDERWEFENKTPVDTRRILNGKKVERGARPYMVYLQSNEKSKNISKTKGWLCGGVIVHKEYVITSAACVEDVNKIYVIAGTIKARKNRKDNECFQNNKRRVVWKCVPKNHKFECFTESEWSVNDIAVLKVDKPFKLGQREEGCQFAARCTAYNNISRELEEPGTKGFVLGWGRDGKFRESEYRKSGDSDDDDDSPSQCLQEARVCLMDKEKCAQQWPPEMRELINDYMICTKDTQPQMSKKCTEYANCEFVSMRRELPGNHTVTGDQTVEANVTEVTDPRRQLRNPDYYAARRAQDLGGFCVNDYGGPLVVRYGGEDHVVGVISAHKIDSEGKKCHGPFLYTSVFTNRQFLSCAIYKDVDEDCRRVFRGGLTHKEWTVDWDDEE